MKYAVKDTVVMKKPHACGENLWEITRTGADFKIKCLKCNKIVMLEIEEFLRRVKKHIPFK